MDIKIQEVSLEEKWISKDQHVSDEPEDAAEDERCPKGSPQRIEDRTFPWRVVPLHAVLFCNPKKPNHAQIKVLIFVVPSSLNPQFPCKYPHRLWTMDSLKALAFLSKSSTTLFDVSSTSRSHRSRKVIGRFQPSKMRSVNQENQSRDKQDARFSGLGFCSQCVIHYR